MVASKERIKEALHYYRAWRLWSASRFFTISFERLNSRLSHFQSREFNAHISAKQLNVSLHYNSVIDDIISGWHYPKPSRLPPSARKQSCDFTAHRVVSFTPASFHSPARWLTLFYFLLHWLSRQLLFSSSSMRGWSTLFILLVRQPPSSSTYHTHLFSSNAGIEALLTDCRCISEYYFLFTLG